MLLKESIIWRKKKKTKVENKEHGNAKEQEVSVFLTIPEKRQPLGIAILRR